MLQVVQVLQEQVLQVLQVPEQVLLVRVPSAEPELPAVQVCYLQAEQSSLPELSSQPSVQVLSPEVLQPVEVQELLLPEEPVQQPPELLKLQELPEYSVVQTVKQFVQAEALHSLQVLPVFVLLELQPGHPELPVLPFVLLPLHALQLWHLRLPLYQDKVH